MSKRSNLCGLTLSILGLVTVPASARHHQGEAPETGHHRQNGKPAAGTPSPVDDKNHHPSGKGRNDGGHGKDDVAEHQGKAHA